MKKQSNSTDLVLSSEAAATAVSAVSAEEDECSAEVALARLRLYLSPHAGNTTGAVNNNASEEGDDETDRDEDSSQISSLPPRSGEVATVRPLSPISREFLRVKYLLQASLPGFDLKDQVMIWDMRNPALVASYEQYTSGFLELDSWVAVDALGPENCMADVYSCGFMSPRKGKRATGTKDTESPHSPLAGSMKFTTGNLLMENQFKKGSCQYVLCKIAVGRSYVISSESEASQGLPSGYNSFVLEKSHDNTTTPTSSSANSRGYTHEYILNNSVQVMPQYMVQFSYAPYHKEVTPICALCESKPAKVSCKQCAAVLCKGCDTEVHEANKLVSRHKRVAISATASFSGGAASTLLDHPVCSKHKDQGVEFYCPECATPVCVHCKMVGDHSGGEAATHRLVTIADAYTTGLSESARSDPLIESRLSVIKTKCRDIRSRTQQIQDNSAAVETQIKAAATAAVTQLQSETVAKLKTLSGEGLELARQVEHINWAEGFLCQQRRELSPVEFLNTWNHHKVLRTELRDFPVMYHPLAAEVAADLQLVGRLQVLTGEGGGSASNGHSAAAKSATIMSRLNITTSGNEDLGNSLATLSILPNNDHHHSNGNVHTREMSAMLSPKSTLLLAKVKSDLSKNVVSNARTLTSHSRRPSTSSMDALSISSSTTIGGFKKKMTLDGCNDEWTQKIRQEMQKKSTIESSTRL